MLIRLHCARAYERGADEAQPDRLELAGWKLSGGIAGPEAVPVARDDAETGDLRVANEVVNLSALMVGGTPFVGAQDAEVVRRP